METLRFEANIPHEVILKYDEGKPVKGKFGEQIMYTLEGDAVMYVPLIVADKIKELGKMRGVPIGICKREVRVEGKKQTRWEVERVVVEPAAVPQVTAAPAPAPTRKPAQQENAPNGALKPETQAAIRMSACLTACAIAAIDAAKKAEAYAAKNNFPLKFREDQIQGWASTLYIQTCKEHNIGLINQRDHARAAGGADPWRN